MGRHLTHLELAPGHLEPFQDHHLDKGEILLFHLDFLDRDFDHPTPLAHPIVDLIQFALIKHQQIQALLLLILLMDQLNTSRLLHKTSIETTTTITTTLTTTLTTTTIIIIYHQQLLHLLLPTVTMVLLVINCSRVDNHQHHL